ncbi:MAG: ATP-binding cassette domain-containing protein [Bacteroidetes bacterium]|jgi:ABC-2 type transport system ATP-binding protein|nr:ATP-binding cassette domain-containing protein [Bacteroidota bacterium]
MSPNTKSTASDPPPTPSSATEAAQSAQDSSTDEPVIIVESLAKSFGEVDAIRSIDFEVLRGQVFCLVGPNGAGKTTTINCITGLETPDTGTVRVLGAPPAVERSHLFETVGVQFQENSLYPRITVSEALHHFARFYEDPLSPDALLNMFALEHRRGSAYKSLSGGEKRKLCVALALIGQPKLAILDEPTSGLDPHARQALWEILQRLSSEGLTILLTTHNLQEAEEESDVVCMLDKGTILATGQPAQLVADHELGTRVAVETNGHVVTRSFDEVPGLSLVEQTDRSLRLYGTGSAFVPALTDVLEAEGFRKYSVRPAGLEDLYLIVTGNPYAKNHTRMTSSSTDSDNSPPHRQE